jgi:repressor LexA
MLAQRILELRKQKGITQNTIAKYLNISRPAYTRYESGAREPDYETVSKLAQYFEVSVDYLIGCTEDPAPQLNNDYAARFPNVELHSFKVIGAIHAGFDGIAEEIDGERVEIPASFLRGVSPAEFFVLRVKGSSMYPEVLEGDFVLVRRTPTVDSGSMAVIMYDGDEATVKRVKYVKGQDWLELVPTNPEYETKRIEGADLELCRVLGKVITQIRNIN